MLLNFVFGLGIVTLILLATKKNLFPLRSIFTGNWNGTYIGESDNGAWSILVTGDGKITGTIISSVSKSDYIVTGSVDKNGIIEMAIREEYIIVFDGILNANSATATGTYINLTTDPGQSGTWFGEKQFN